MPFNRDESIMILEENIEEESSEPISRFHYDEDNGIRNANDEANGITASIGEDESDLNFEFIVTAEVEQAAFLDKLLDKELEVCIKPNLSFWRRGRIVSYDTKRATYAFLVKQEDEIRTFPFFKSVFQVLDPLPQERDEEWVDLGGNFMLESTVCSDRMMWGQV